MDSAKAIWRKALRERLRSLRPEQIVAHSRSICLKIYHSPSWPYAQTVALFADRSPEPQLQHLAELAWAEGKTVLCPRVADDESTLVFHRLESWGDLLPGRWEIPEPRASNLVHGASEPIDLICVPGLGFDRRGARLGQGRGFYDRFLATLPEESIKLGVFFSLQEVPEIPELSHDYRLDGVVTEQELFLL